MMMTKAYSEAILRGLKSGMLESLGVRPGDAETSDKLNVLSLAFDCCVDAHRMAGFVSDLNQNEIVRQVRQRYVKEYGSIGILMWIRIAWWVWSVVSWFRNSQPLKLGSNDSMYMQAIKAVDE